MLKIIYIITMAIAFTSNYMGANTNYFLRLGIGLFWIIFWAIRSKFVIKTSKFLRYQLVPWICIFALTIFLWLINRPTYFDSSYVSRLISNTLYCLVAVVNAYVGIDLFKKDVVKVSFFALLVSIGFNFVSVWQEFGTANTVYYLKTILNGNYEYGSIMEDLMMHMEVQGATMALGIFFVYFLFFNKEEKKIVRIIYILLCAMGLYIGFKRVVMLGIGLVVLILWMLVFKRINVKNVILYSFITFFVISFGYIVIVKTDLISAISLYFNVDMMGRTNIYRNASKLFEINPLYLGTGYTYAAKYLYETTGFAVHSDILRMYIELGFFPFVAWLWYNLYFLPQKVVDWFGQETGKIYLAVTIFAFSTFLVENTLGLYPLHYGLVMFSMLQLANNQTEMYE